MADADDINQAIIDGAVGPLKATGDSGSIEQRPLVELIAADKYENAKAAATGGRPGFKIFKMVPPGGD